MPSQWAPRIDDVTAWFFLLSAISHGAWLLVSMPLCRVREIGDVYFWGMLQKCLCWWWVTRLPRLPPTPALTATRLYRRWLEYSFSASLMLVAIGMITALRQVDVMVAIFMLNFTTMWCGFITEVHSRPAVSSYKNGKPVYDYEIWRGQEKDMSLGARWRNYTW